MIDERRQGADARTARPRWRPPYRSSTQLTAAEMWQVLALRNGGESVSEFVADYGVSRANIYRANPGSGANVATARTYLDTPTVFAWAP